MRQNGIKMHQTVCLKPVTLRIKAEAILPSAPEVLEVQSDDLQSWPMVISLLALDWKVS